MLAFGHGIVLVKVFAVLRRIKGKVWCSKMHKKTKKNIFNVRFFNIRLTLKNISQFLGITKLYHVVSCRGLG